MPFNRELTNEQVQLVHMLHIKIYQKYYFNITTAKKNEN